MAGVGAITGKIVAGQEREQPDLMSALMLFCKYSENVTDGPLIITSQNLKPAL